MSLLPTAVTSPLGTPIPAILPHAVSVSLPTWKDNVDYEEGAQRVVSVMQTGYPRFFIHRSIQKACIQRHRHYILLSTRY